ncbi:MAG: hypothetical protein ACK4TA_18385 [Saprospiraceae bacterium]
MDQLELKERIIRQAYEAYNATIEMHRATEQDMAADAFNAENDAGEMADDSNKLETLDDVQQMAEIIDEREEVLLDLEKIIPVLHEEVTLGSVIMTDQRNFFVGESVAEFEVEGAQYTGISPEAPIYKALEGKKSGDSVEFRGVKYAIESVF